MGKLIYDYQSIVAAVIIFLAVLLYAETTKFSAIKLGDTALIIFDGENIHKICDIASDYCFVRDQNLKFHSFPLNFHEAVEEMRNEEMRFKTLKEKYMKKLNK